MWPETKLQSEANRKISSTEQEWAFKSIISDGNLFISLTCLKEYWGCNGSGREGPERSWVVFQEMGCHP